MKQLVAAVIDLHVAGVSHGDIKSDNILVEQNVTWSVPRVRIIDFGCGSLLKTSAGTSFDVLSNSAVELFSELC